jgi:pyruvate-formate lyase-activating enzyme
VLGTVADVVRFSWVDGPGNRFVVFFQGCNLNCLACHNPHTIPCATPRARLVGIDELVAEVRPVAPFLSGVTVSGGEATLQAPFVEAFFGALAAPDGLPGLTRFVDSNGHAAPEVWDALLPLTDGVMLDLKAIDPAVHRFLTGHDNDRVLASVRQVAAAGKLHEVRLLLVPGINDDPAMIRTTANWLLDIDPTVRVKVIGFRAHGVRASARSWPEPDQRQRDLYREQLVQLGVRDLEVV